MRNLLFWVVLALVGGCTNTTYYFYPGTTVPKSCKVSDGYCYHRYIQDNQMWVDVFVWSPQKGWTFHHKELAQ